MAFNLADVTEEQSEQFFGFTRSFSIPEEGQHRIGWYLDVPMLGRLGDSKLVSDESSIPLELDNMRIGFGGAMDTFHKYIDRFIKK